MAMAKHAHVASASDQSEEATTAQLNQQQMTSPGTTSSASPH
jgi:hypothetical protein